MVLPMCSVRVGSAPAAAEKVVEAGPVMRGAGRPSSVLRSRGDETMVALQSMGFST